MIESCNEDSPWNSVQQTRDVINVNNHPPWKNQGFRYPPGLPLSARRESPRAGIFIGTGTTSRNTSGEKCSVGASPTVVPPRRCFSEEVGFEGRLFSFSAAVWSASIRSLMIGTRTPHSQFRQFSRGCFVSRSLTSLPHALSERLALPTYAQPLHCDLPFFIGIGLLGVTYRSCILVSHMHVEGDFSSTDLVVHEHISLALTI